MWKVNCLSFADARHLPLGAPMPESLMLALLDRAQCWAASAGTTLRRRHEWTPAAFTTGRRPEDRALLAARYAEHRAWVDAGGNAAEGGV